MSVPPLPEAIAEVPAAEAVAGIDREVRRFRVGAQLQYDVSQPSTTLILNVHAQHNTSQRIVEEQFRIDPHVQVEELALDLVGNRFIRLDSGRHPHLTVTYQAAVEVRAEHPSSDGQLQASVSDLDRSVIGYLFPSRYCQSDRLSRLAGDLFGKIANPYSRVLAIADWIFDNVEYLHGTTDSQTSAFDTVTQRAGVCRDFAHLGIALCRALSIPARYFTGYAYRLQPPDFHACFEAYIGGRWLVFDPTRLAAANGLVRIATGRDAADAAVASIFGRAVATTMAVTCELMSPEAFTPAGREAIQQRGVSLEASEFRT